MKTALQQLLQKIEEYQKESGVLSINIGVLKKEINDTYIGIEKQQIEKAYHSGLAHEFGCMEDYKYYASTFSYAKDEKFDKPLKDV